MSRYLLFKIVDFYMAVNSGEYNQPLQLAKALEKLSDEAWDEVDEQYQGAIRIDP